MIEEIDSAKKRKNVESHNSLVEISCNNGSEQRKGKVN